MTGVVISFLGTAVAVGGSLYQVVSAANPLPVTLSGGIGGLSVAGTIADGSPVLAQFPVTIGGVDYATGFVHRLNTDASGNLNVNVVAGGGSSTVLQGAGNVANPWTVQGPVAGAVATSGNPIKVGGVFNTTTPTYATGQSTELQTTSRGLVLIAQGSSTGAPVLTFASGADAQSNNGVGQLVYNFQSTFNGSSWDRFAKPRTAFRIPSSAATNNAANIKASPGTVYSISANVTLAASTCYLKFFDTTAAPNPAALTPLYMFALNIVDGMVSLNMPTNGLYFPTGIGVAIVANPADLDNTAIAAGQVTALNVSFQ